MQASMNIPWHTLCYRRFTKAHHFNVSSEGKDCESCITLCTLPTMGRKAEIREKLQVSMMTHFCLLFRVHRRGQNQSNLESSEGDPKSSWHPQNTDDMDKQISDLLFSSFAVFLTKEQHLRPIFPGGPINNSPVYFC